MWALKVYEQRWEVGEMKKLLNICECTILDRLLVDFFQSLLRLFIEKRKGILCSSGHVQRRLCSGTKSGDLVILGSSSKERSKRILLDL